MAIATGLVRAALNTSTGTQDFRDPNMTETPNAALITLVGVTADGTPTNDSRMCIGATDGTNEWYCAVYDEHNQSSASNSSRRADTGALIASITDATLDGLAVFDSWLADAGSGAGMRINITTAFPAAYLLEVKLFKVDNALAGTFTNGLQDTSNTVTTNFTTTLAFFATHNYSFGGASNVHNILSVGACDGSLNQYCTDYMSRDARTTTTDYARPRSNRCCGAMDAVGSWTWFNEVTAITSTNFTVYTRNSDQGNGDVTGFLALDTGSVGTYVGSVTTPTATGSDSQTGPNFKPQLCVVGVGMNSSWDTPVTDNTAGVFGLAAFTANNEYCATIAFEDNVATTNTQSLSDDAAVNVPDDDGTNVFTATFTQFTSTGWDWSFSVTDTGTARYWWVAAIEEDAAGNDPISGSAAGEATAAGTLTGTGALAGAADGETAVSGLLTGTAALSGGAAGQTTAYGILTAKGALAGSAEGQTTVAGVLAGIGALAGAADGLATAVGVLSDAAGDFISGAAIGQATASGILTGTGALAGAADGLATAVGILTGTGQLAGAAAGQATASGLLTAAGVILIGDALVADAAYETAVLLNEAYETAVLADDGYETAVLEDVLI